MRTFAQKQKATQHAVSAKSTIPNRAKFWLRPEGNSIIHLQRTIGNQAVQRLLQSNTEELQPGLASTAVTRFAHDFSQIPLHPETHAKIQRKLTVSTPGDIYEQEADRVADEVMRMPETRPPDQERYRLQTKQVEPTDLGQTAVHPIAHKILRSPGQPLDSTTRDFMEPRFGHDLSSVRIHSYAQAAEAARSVQALAYTTGSDIVFGEGQYKPGTDSGRKLLAHELVHVIQQQRGSAPGMIQRQEEVSDELLRSELENQTTQGLMRLYADSFNEGRREQPLEGISRGYSRRWARGHRDLLRATLVRRFENAFRERPRDWFEYHNFVHSQLAPPEARTQIYQMLIDSRHGQPLPEEARPLTPGQEEPLFNAGIRRVRLALAEVAQGEVRRRALRPNVWGPPDSQVAAVVSAALRIFPTTIGELMSGHSGMLPIERQMQLPEARAIRIDIPVAQAARSAWRGLSPGERNALSSRRSAAIAQLNQEIFDQMVALSERTRMRFDSDDRARLRRVLGLD